MTLFSAEFVLFIFKLAAKAIRFSNLVTEGALCWLVGLHLRVAYGWHLEWHSIRWLSTESGKRWAIVPSTAIDLTIVVATYKQPIALDCLLLSLQCQTLQNFEVLVIHDGPDSETGDLVLKRKSSGLNCRYLETNTRFNDYGHSLRELGIAAAQSPFVLITNGDNYYVPRFLEFAFDAIRSRNLDMLLFDMIHSHNGPGDTRLLSYCPFPVYPLRRYADIATLVVKTRAAGRVGFRDKSHSGDATYLEDLLQSGLVERVGKLQKTLVVHN